MLNVTKPLISQVHKYLIKKAKSIAVAESCTGGLLSNWLTSLPGSSSYFKLGAVVYSNEAKTKILKIPASLIANKGAVSCQVARKMASSVRNSAKTDFGIGITGIAGPGGGSVKKPVGTVFIALDCRKKKICKEFYFSGNRQAIRKKSVINALILLRNIM